MELIHIISFTIVAFILVVSPGPNGVLIVKSVSSSGYRAGFANIGGFLLAFCVHGSLSILGISALLVQSSEAFLIFKVIGAAYLIWIGIKSCWEAWKHETSSVTQEISEKTSTLSKSFLEGFITNVLNPKVSMFYLAAFPQFLSASDGALQAYFLVAIHSALNVIWFSVMVLFLSKVKSYSSNQNLTRWFKSVTGPVFIGFGAKLAFLKQST